MNLLNLTKHEISVMSASGVLGVYPPSGHVAEVQTIEEPIATIRDIEIVSRSFGEVKGIPFDLIDSYDGFLVSSMVLDAISEGSNSRKFFAPDSGLTAKRNEKGHVIHVVRLIGKK